MSATPPETPNTLLAAVIAASEADATLAQVAIDCVLAGQERVRQTGFRNAAVPAFERLDGTPMTEDDSLVHQCAHVASIGKMLGADFLRKTSALVLQQFAVVSGNQGLRNSGETLANLLHNFMISLATKETEERALKLMLDAARLGSEATERREIRGDAV